MRGPIQGSFQVDYDAADDLLRLEYVGRMTRELIVAAADATFTTPGITDRTCVLAVFVDADIDEIDLEALAFFQAHKTDKGYPNLPAAAVVADRPSHLAMARLWVATKPGGESGSAWVFTNEAAARAWLLSGR